MPAPLDRPVTSAEYDELVDYAIKKGITNAFIQDASSAAESFIPPFDSTGV
jgi:putative pyruvate formate lyase activating enzyme